MQTRARLDAARAAADPRARRGPARVVETRSLARRAARRARRGSKRLEARGKRFGTRAHDDGWDARGRGDDARGRVDVQIDGERRVVDAR